MTAIAVPAHPSAASPERFSNATIAIRRAVFPGVRVQVEKESAAPQIRRTLCSRKLKNTRLQREQLLKLRKLLKLGELGLFLELLLVFEAFFQSLAHVDQSPLDVSRLGVRLRKIEVKFRAL